MNTSKISITFVLAKSRINKAGKCSLRCRITYKKARYEFATGLFVLPENWQNSQQVTTPANQENNYINTEISLMRNKISQAFLLLKIQDANFSVEDIFLAYKGKNIKAEKTILEVFELHNTKMQKLIGKSYTNATYYKFKETKRHIQNFIKHEYNKKDYLLSNLNLNFLEKFDYYLNAEVKQKQITINKTIQRLRKIIKLAISEDFIVKDPFLLYVPKRVKTTVVFLNNDELQLLKNYQFTNNDRLQRVKDCFIFCCYTGLAFSEMEQLSKEHFIQEFDGNIWIKMTRKKTKGQVSVPLLKPAKEILYKYRNEPKPLPVISNQKFNSYLKEISAIVGIDKKITHHVARKTFASTVLLYNNVPMEIVSELLGHSKITTTQLHYGKIVQRKVSEHINQLAKKL
ncbi:integrase [Flavobacterium columnare]|uniref:site-specific integrase n=1 Tax=Flavobacterium columnare TaxID=996 RepID=UPI0018963ECE|nr:site-specific integrase [Flavobacterium columnare]MBF6654058.1 integrase [Flavobacterium columnare]MBF6655049.1 integrase [Flavobacterium columnare]